MRKYREMIVLIFSLRKDIDVTLKKDKNVSDKSWGWSPQDILIRSYLGSCKSEHHKFLKEKTQFYFKIHLSFSDHNHSVSFPILIKHSLFIFISLFFLFFPSFFFKVIIGFPLHLWNKIINKQCDMHGRTLTENISRFWKEIHPKVFL